MGRQAKLRQAKKELRAIALTKDFANKPKVIVDKAVLDAYNKFKKRLLSGQGN